MCFIVGKMLKSGSYSDMQAMHICSDSSLHEKVDYTVANEKNIKETGPREIETKVGTSYT